MALLGDNHVRFFCSGITERMIRLIWAAIIVLVIALDQISKLIVINNMELGQNIVIIKNFFHLTYWENSGAAWGIFKNGALVFIPLNLILSAVLAYILINSKSNYLRFSLSLIIGGALGNVIDRIFRNGKVVDFLSFNILGYDYPIFNIADSFIVIGTIFLAYYLLFIYKEKDKIIS